MYVCVDGFFQREFIYCYLYVVMLLKSVHYSGGQPILLPSGVDVRQPIAQHVAMTPCSDVPVDEDDVNTTASGQSSFRIYYYCH